MSTEQKSVRFIIFEDWGTVRVQLGMLATDIAVDSGTWKLLGREDPGTADPSADPHI